MPTTGCPSCYNAACPELVPVTIEQNEYTLEVGGAIELEWVELTPSTGELTINLVDSEGDLVTSGSFEVLLRFVDDDSILDVPSPVPPATPGYSEARIHLTAGTRTISVEYTGSPSKTWYPVVSFAGSLARNNSAGNPVVINLG